MSVFIFLLILTFLVIIHELGHFFVALWARVRIEEFGIGLPPKAKVLFHWRGIPFTLNWLPIGGFVKMEGEDGSAEVPNSKNQIPNEKSPYFPFYTRPAYQRLLVILAGPFVNIMFGVIAFTIIFSIMGIPVRLEHPLIAKVLDGAPAEKAGLQSGDLILSAVDISAFITMINDHRGESVKIKILRDKTEKEISVYVRKTHEIPAGQGAIGVALSQEEVRFFPWWQMPFRAVPVGFSQSFEFAGMILRSLGTIVTDLRYGKVSSDVAGPVGIAYQVGKEKIFSQGILSILNFAALLSINLGIMNLLPIPALDGGRAVFIVVERFLSKKLRFRLENTINTVGFVFLLTLMLLITIKDTFVILKDLF